MKHTPRPWNKGKQNRIEAMTNGKGGCLLVISELEISGRTWGECCANSTLIASAPDLLEACKEMLAWMQNCALDTITTTPNAVSECIKAKAAIQKAEGL